MIASRTNDSCRSKYGNREDKCEWRGPEVNCLWRNKNNAGPWTAKHVDKMLATSSFLFLLVNNVRCCVSSVQCSIHFSRAVSVADWLTDSLGRLSYKCLTIVYKDQNCQRCVELVHIELKSHFIDPQNWLYQNVSVKLFNVHSDVMKGVTGVQYPSPNNS